MITPKLVSNRPIRGVSSLSQAQNLALAKVEQHSGIPLKELVTEEGLTDGSLFITVKHLKSNRSFHFEFKYHYSQ